ncbi:MAG: mannitol dehydrogenase family protein, partial [Erysipelotrichales bacterium]|nr:mannitol dehydrogenase family protein [Erysipelotrichales bacterium]
MKLTQRDITENRAEWISKGYEMPEYDREKMIEKTKAHPQWVHFGPGNIFRSFQAVGAQKLLNEGAADTGIIAVDGHSYEIVPKSYRPHDNLCVAVTLRTRGTVGKTVVGSIAETVILDPDNAPEIRRMKEIFRAPSLQMVSFTITEKGYAVKDTAGHLLPETEKDLKTGPSAAYAYIGKLTALLYERYLAGQYPLALVSMDNMSHNGDKLREAVILYADAWVKAGNAEPGFASYVKDSSKVSFPWSMIDKITPRPDDSVNEILKKDGVEELDPVVTPMKT